MGANPPGHGILCAICFLTALTLLSVIMAIWSRKWPSTQGRLIEAVVTPELSGGQYAESPSVTYEYEVGGRTYRSSLIHPTGDLSWGTNIPGVSSASLQLDDIINRGEPAVFYCPLFPRYACLRPGGLSTSLFWAVLATIFWIIALSTSH